MMEDDELETKPKLLVTDTMPSSSGGIDKEPAAVDLLVFVEDASHWLINEDHPSQTDLLKSQLSLSIEDSVPQL